MKYIIVFLNYKQMRDLKMIGHKLKYVLLPQMKEDQGKELRNCKIILILKKMHFENGIN